MLESATVVVIGVCWSHWNVLECITTVVIEVCWSVLLQWSLECVGVCYCILVVIGVLLFTECCILLI